MRPVRNGLSRVEREREQERDGKLGMVLTADIIINLRATLTRLNVEIPIDRVSAFQSGEFYF